MKKIFFLSAILLCNTTAFADQTKVNKPETASKEENTIKQDIQKFCYLNDKSYSKGAVVDDRICTKTTSTAMYDEETHLRWEAITASNR